MEIGQPMKRPPVIKSGVDGNPRVCQKCLVHWARYMHKGLVYCLPCLKNIKEKENA